MTPIPKRVPPFWMLSNSMIEQIEKCKHKRRSKDALANQYCLLSKHDCNGNKPRTKDYKPEYFDCLCLCYAGLCPAGIQVGWQLVKPMKEDETCPKSPKQK